MVKKVSTQKTTTFWDKLPKPFFVLAPMANVTDFAFRSMIAKYGKPDVIWNEFVSANGLCSPGRARLMHDLKFSPKERPIVAQLFTGDPVSMKKAAQLCAELGFDGVDLNMGCPDRAIEKQGSGAGHIKDQKRAIEVLNAAREGAQRKGKSLPISVKTRIGYNKLDMDWVRSILMQKPPALTIHLRTRKEMSDVPAHWELMPEFVKLRNEVSPVTLIIGNGDVQTVVEAAEKCATYGCDGVMIGRGIFGTPWLFEDKETIRKSGAQTKLSAAKTPEERLTIMLEHTKLFEKTYCGTKNLKNFAVMKKHFKAYVSGWDGAKELRAKLMETNGYKEVKGIVDMYLDSSDKVF
ncbi:MAG: tRNA-dihydrouridine synthase [Candidatus Pacebacteria bacterium]|nr:tRNA-dihydrouridine synthase [Candidatus Paceibacterota bacterium]